MTALLTPTALRLLDEVGLLDSKADVLALITRLRKAGHDASLVTEVVTQARLRTRAVAKFGDFAASMLFTEAGLEQATRLPVAAIHAERFRTAGFDEIADLGCGIGADSLAMAALGLRVTAVEKDSFTAALTSYNLAAFPNAQVQIASAEEVNISQFSAIWLDPSRRDLDKKTLRHTTLSPEDFSPSLNWAFAIDKPKGIKLGPAFPHELIPVDAEAQWVSHQGDLVELVLWFDGLKQSSQRSALMIKNGERHLFEGDIVRPDMTPLGEYILEPDSSLIRSGLMGDLAVRHNLTAISEGIAYLTSNSNIQSPWLRTYRVLEVLPLDEVQIRKALAARNIGSLEIKKRGVDITPEQLRPKLRLKGEGAATLILTKIGDARRALIVEPIR